MNIKGHNGYSPCRSCDIKGVRMIGAGGTNYYTPLTTPHQPRQTRPSLDPLSLPLRTNARFIRVLEDLDLCVTKHQRDLLSKEHGIRGEPSLVRVSSLDYATCAPWEWMHLFLENIAPMLVDLWTGRFKGLDEGTEEYELAPHIWEEIGQETAAAVRDIPAAFVRALGNIASERSSFTAEAWGFWFMYLAPILLQNRFRRRKYYMHMCKLVSLMKTSIKLELSVEEIDGLEQGFAEWVQEYERYYYQYDEARLPVCTLPVHGCLHVANDLRMSGPAWVHWTFYVERYCLFLKTGLRSRRNPWSGLSRVILFSSYLSQLSVKFDLSDELESFSMRRGQDILANEKLFESYPDLVLRTPCRSDHVPDEDTRRRIGVYLVQIVGGRRSDLATYLPRVMPLWGKLRIINGDSIRSKYSMSRAARSGSSRNNSFVRFEVTYATADESHPINTVGYGQLDAILVCKLGHNKIYRHLCATELILALITPCKTNGKDASESIVGYKELAAQVVTDARNITGVVGRVQTQGGTFIIDRSVKATAFSDGRESDTTNSDSD
ncbi:hypothetical protein BDR06DRAFT_922829 [Suillus hirtellus]|nr:hypothetical protein BDR06DRAFT_922829 [Suillus hirtellus]